MRIRALVVLIAINTLGLVLAGCAGNASPNPPAPPAAPQILTPPTNQTATAGQSASFSVTASGAAPLSYQWNKNGNPVSGATSATYTTPPTILADNGSSFSVVVSNSKGSVASTAATLTVNPTSATLAITSAANATFVVGTAALFTVTATGTPTPFLTETGTLPSGVTFTSNGNTGTLSGTPAGGTAGAYSISFTAANGVATPATQTFTLTINTVPVITSASSATFVAGTPGTFSVTATGAPTPSLTETGALPGGVSFVDNGNGTGTLSGTAAAGTGGKYAITINASSSSGSTPQNFVLVVDQGPAISTANSTTFTVGLSGLFAIITNGFPTASVTEAGTLPNGVTFIDNGNGSGKLIGIPAAGTGKTYPLTFTANNGVGSPVTQSFTLTVDEAATVTSPNSTAFTVGTAGTFTVTTSGFPAPALTETGALPAGVTFASSANGTGTLSGTPAAGTAGTYPITFTATNGLGTPASQTFTLTVSPANVAPAITSAGSTTFTVGAAGTFTVTTTGFPTSTLAETGLLPSGVTFTNNGNGTGTLAGTPAAGTGKTYSFTLTASNGVGSPASQAFTLTVDQAPALTSAVSATFTAGTAGTFTATTTGFPAPALTETGALPAGVTFTNNGNGTGTLSGTPATATAGTYSLTFTASNGVGTPATQSFTLTVNPANSPPAVTSASSITFAVGTADTFSVTSTGTPTPSLTETGTLPSGVTFKDNANGTGTLSGTPAAGTAGTYPITFTASNGVGTPATQSFTLTVNPANAAPLITSASSTTFTVATAGTFSVTTTGTPTPSLTETGTLPSGVTFKDNGNGTGTLAGTPAAGTGKAYAINLTASNGVGTAASQSFTLTVDQAPAITSPNSTTFTVGTSASFTVLTTGFPAPSLSESGALPGGLTFMDNGNGTGTLSGTPASGSVGAYSLAFTASNGVGTPGTQAFTLTVNSAPVITSTGSATFTVATAGTFSVTTAGTPTPSLTETGTLPSGVTFTDNANGTGTLSGTPAAGTGAAYAILIKATSTSGSTSQSFTLTVDQAPAITSASSATFATATAGTFTVKTTGFPTPTLAETGLLPSGVTFTNNGNGTGTLSGTPATGTAGTYPITLTATNGAGPAATQTFTLTVAASITCGTGHESVLKGQYAFLFHGFDANGPVVVAGMFSADGTGKVGLLAGIEDISTTAGVQTDVPINSAGSSYSVGSDNRGCLSIATGSATSKYAFSMGSLNISSVAARGRMIEIDSTGTLGSGELRLQDPTAFSTAAITGSFNFGVSTTLSLSTTVPNRFAMVGSFTASAGAITGGEADFNLSGSVDGGAAGPLAMTGGSYGVASNGRGTLSFTISGAGTFNANIYVVAAKEFFLININPQSASNPLFAGTAHLQSGPFTISSLSGNAVFYTIGLCTTCGPGSTVASDLSIGIISVATAGSFTLTGDQNQGGTLATQSFAGTYTVDSTGRAVLQSSAVGPYILYLETTGRGFLMTTGSEVGEGFADPQKGAPFTNASLTSVLSSGTADQSEENVTDSSGITTFNGSGTVSGTMDSAALGSFPSANAFSDSYSVTNGTTGRGTITSNGATVSIFYLISTTHLVLMDAGTSSGAANAHPAIGVARQ